jgi:UDP-glucuronate 4-epimerase
MRFLFKTVLVTGAAGFIGFHLSRRLLTEGYDVVGIDNMNPYYDINLKRARLERLKEHDNFRFHQIDIANKPELENVFGNTPFDIVVNLAAQAGVRYSLSHPEAYVTANLVGFGNLLEACRHNETNHLVFASSSSVYGANTNMPFSVHHNVDHPVSLYAATKKANELMAHAYSHLYDIHCTGLRFFTVYGPWGRPDMALYLFARAILEGEPIKVFNHGNMQRDFTYIDDIIEGVVRVMGRLPEPNSEWTGDHPDPGTSYTRYRIYNIGNNQPVNLLDFIAILEKALGRAAKKEFLDLQPGDVLSTYADVDDLVNDVGFRPKTPLTEGINRFVKWFKDFYGYR